MSFLMQYVLMIPSTLSCIIDQHTCVCQLLYNFASNIHTGIFNVIYMHQKDVMAVEWKDAQSHFLQICYEGKLDQIYYVCNMKIYWTTSIV